MQVTHTIRFHPQKFACQFLVNSLCCSPRFLSPYWVKFYCSVTCRHSDLIVHEHLFLQFIRPVHFSSSSLITKEPESLAWTSVVSQPPPEPFQRILHSVGRVIFRVANLIKNHGLTVKLLSLGWRANSVFWLARSFLAHPAPSYLCHLSNDCFVQWLIALQSPNPLCHSLISLLVPKTLLSTSAGISFLQGNLFNPPS